MIWGYLLCGPSLKGDLSQFGRALSVVGNFPPYWIVQSTHNNKFQFVVVPGFFKSLFTCVKIESIFENPVVVVDWRFLMIFSFLCSSFLKYVNDAFGICMSFMNALCLNIDVLLIIYLQS